MGHAMFLEDLIGLTRHLAQTRGIARRYAIVNGFDGALTMLGLLSGFLLGGEVALHTVIAACMGAAVAARRGGPGAGRCPVPFPFRDRLTGHPQAEAINVLAWVGSLLGIVPWVVALVNGGSPVLLSCIIVSPLWLAEAGVVLPFDALPTAIGAALVCILT